jgi:hypothetical protein
LEREARRGEEIEQRKRRRGLGKRYMVRLGW